MDKKERNSIVQAKLTEVLNQENRKEFEKAQDRSKELLDKLNGGTIVQELNDLRHKHDELIGKLILIRKKENEILKAQNGNDGNNIYMNWSEIGTENGTGKRHKPNPFYLSNNGYDNSYHQYSFRSDLMTMLVEHRNSDNKRIAKVCDAGLKLVFEGDESTIKDFLAL